MCVKEGDKKKNLDYANHVCYMPLEDHTFDMSLNLFRQARRRATDDSLRSHTLVR